MKKYLSNFAVAIITVVGLASCSSIRHTSTVVDINTPVASFNQAKLNVSPTKIEYKYIPTSAVKRCGEKNVISTAVAEALKANGNADVLVSFQYEMKKKKNLFGKTSIKYVTVKGYPATYSDFETVTK